MTSSTITLVNDGKLGHSIDFHASKVAWNDEMRTIEPGESLVYQFEAKHAGVVMYTVFKEGTYVLQPDGRRGGAQALDLQPSQGGFVEFSFDEAGLYPIVTHEFANVGKGALGLFQAGEVDATGGGH